MKERSLRCEACMPTLQLRHTLAWVYDDGNKLLWATEECGRWVHKLGINRRLNEACPVR